MCIKSRDIRLTAHGMNKNTIHYKLYQRAEQQAGYFTSAQAAERGFSRKLLWYHEKMSHFIRVARGIYRIAQFPSSRFEDLFVAWLRCGPKAVISHDSALAVYDLSDVIPGEIHVTVLRTASRRRKGIRQHTAPLGPSDVKRREGLPVTSVPRTIADVSRAGLPEELVREAIQQSLDRGLTNRASLQAQANRRGGRTAYLIRKYITGLGASS